MSLYFLLATQQKLAGRLQREHQQPPGLQRHAPPALPEVPRLQHGAAGQEAAVDQLRAPQRGEQPQRPDQLQPGPQRQPAQLKLAGQPQDRL